jgi:hypothetical protein
MTREDGVDAELEVSIGLTYILHVLSSRVVE